VRLPFAFSLQDRSREAGVATIGSDSVRHSGARVSGEP